MSISYTATNFNVNNKAFSNSISSPVIIEKISWHEASRTILASCSDGKTRRCRVGNFEEKSRLQDAMLITDALRQAIKSKKEVCLIASGNNSADVWFCGVQEV